MEYTGKRGPKGRVYGRDGEVFNNFLQQILFLLSSLLFGPDLMNLIFLQSLDGVKAANIITAVFIDVKIRNRLGPILAGNRYRVSGLASPLHNFSSCFAVSARTVLQFILERYD